MSYIDNYSEEELQQIVSQSKSFKEVARKIGYSHSPSGDTIKNLKKRLEKFDTSHFTSIQNSEKIERTPENTFCEQSTAGQTTVRRLYLKGNYTDYKCSICQLQPVWNNQPLTLILDHINGINNDDRLENLRWVCPNCNSQLETTGSKNPNRTIFAKKYYCIDCGKEIFKQSKRCISCEAKHRTIPLDEMPISREELKQLIRTIPFTNIGKQFNISDNAIRKWCIKFDLPSKKSEINTYSDEEWEKI